jgi:hypothetical protein
MKHIKKFNESVSSKLHQSRDTKWYRRLGEANSYIWKYNLSQILTKDPNYLPEEDIINLNLLGLGIGSERKSLDPDLSDFENPVEYPLLDKIRNSRFGNCWFLGNLDGETYFTGAGKVEWDICIQYYLDETYLVYIGDNVGYSFYWYECDTYYGLERLIKDMELIPMK